MADSTNRVRTNFARLTPIDGLRLNQILGDPYASPPLRPLIPISKSTWYRAIKRGDFPAPIKLGRKTSLWRRSDIAALLERLNASAQPAEPHQEAA